MNVLSIDCQGNVSEHAFPSPDDTGTTTLAALQRLTGASCVERLPITHLWDAWQSEDAHAEARPVNQLATRLAQDYGHRVRLRGTVIVTGTDDVSGTTVGLTQQQIATLHRRLGDRP